MSSTAVLDRVMGRRLTPLERLAISVVLAALFHVLLLLFLEVAVGLSSLRPRTYLGSVTVELETETVPQLVPQVGPEPTEAPVEPQATAATPAVQPLVEPTAKPLVEPTAKPLVEPTAKPQVAARTEVRPATQPLVEPTAKPQVNPQTEPVVRPQADPVVKPSLAERTSSPAVAATQPQASAVSGAEPREVASVAGGGSSPAPEATQGLSAQPSAAAAVYAAGWQERAGASEERSSGGQLQAASGVPSPPLGGGASEGYVPEVDAPFNPFAPTTTGASNASGAGATTSAASGAGSQAALAQTRGGATGGTVAPATGGRDLVSQVAGQRAGSGTGGTGAGGEGSGTGGGIGDGSGTGTGAGSGVALPLVDPGGRYEVKSAGLEKGKRVPLSAPEPSLSGLMASRKHTVRASIMVMSSGIVIVDRIVGAESTAIEARIRDALLYWSFTPAPGAESIPAEVIFTIVPKR